MSELDPKILGKIRKCLALSASSNPNEAATALRQARSLMEKHGVSSHEVTMSSTGQSSTPSRTMARDKPANWEVRIAALVGKAFGCQFMMQVVRHRRGHRFANNGTYIFIGVAQNAEIASYTASVLIRKCHRARQEWVAQNFAGLGVEVTRGEKTRMGDMFAEGWVTNIEKLVNDFANPPEVDEAIRQHIQERTQGREADVRTPIKKDQKLSVVEQIAAASGMEAAKSERLYRPVNGSSPQQVIGNKE